MTLTGLTKLDIGCLILDHDDCLELISHLEQADYFILVHFNSSYPIDKLLEATPKPFICVNGVDSLAPLHILSCTKKLFIYPNDDTPISERILSHIQSTFPSLPTEYK